MKKTILLFTLISGLAFGQKFELTPNNFVSSEDKTKDYTVVELPGKTQAEIFNTAKVYFNANYKNLKGDGYNEVEPQQIVLTLRSFSASPKLMGISQIGGNFTNRYEINFKDGKMMIKPSFNHVELPDGMGGLEEKSVYNKKGAVSVKAPIFDAIQNKTNEFVSELIAGMKKDNKDW